jgi:hypothetical protein
VMAMSWLRGMSKGCSHSFKTPESPATSVAGK